jgi:tRNA threonylcarbamoyladenosine biosynthesis protein TsaB
MIVLAVDTCLGACSAAVCEDGQVLARISEPMMRGHQERLAPMVAEVMAQAGLAFSALDKIAATVGPGSFTGLRVGLSFAKGLALALDKPCVGVGSLEALAAGTSGTLIVAADARHAQVYWQAFEDGAPLGPAALSPIETIAGDPALLVGPAASLLAARFPDAEVVESAAPDPAAIARIAMTSDAPPKPLYLRKPDAKLPGGIEPSWLT